jgi:hypothetical protein
MDIIHEATVATNIATTSEGNTAGLPGMGLSSRHVQPSAFAGGVRLVSTLPHISAVLNSTRWVKRGWKYQEAMLSRRCLIFSDYQARFVCREEKNSESVVKQPTLRNLYERLSRGFVREQVHDTVKSAYQ